MTSAFDNTIDLPTSSTSLAASAVMYVALELPPILVYGITEAGCMCGNPQCRSPGKHPIGDGWQKRAPRTTDSARDAFAGHRGNIGICLAGTPFVVLDFDGESGLKTLAELEESGFIPATLRARSGGGGAHLFYRLGPHHDPRSINDKRVGVSWDVKKHGQVLAAPSKHSSGQRYEWTHALPIATLTDDLFERIRKPLRAVPSRPSKPKVDATIVERARAYVATMPPAISGAGGHDATFNVARKLVQDFSLGESDAWALLVEYNERCQPPWTEKELRHKLDSAIAAHTSNPVKDRPRTRLYALEGGAAVQSEPSASGGGPGGGAEPDWLASLIWDHSRTGLPKLTSHCENVMRILQHHEDWKGRVRFDEFRGRVVLIGNPPWSDVHRPSSRENNIWTDEDATRLHGWLRDWGHDKGKFNPKVTDCERAIDVVARGHGFHPVREYLESLKWDQVFRLSSMGATYFGARPEPHVELVLRWWMISAAARVFDPGCKADCVLILEGKQGLKKSTALEVLSSSEWFSDTPVDLNSKDAYDQIRGKWIVELAELESLFKVEASRAKAFFSSKKDDYRAAYARRAQEQKRSCVFAGTVNDGTYLKDPTGNRRYWPVRCTQIDLALLARDRDQLWAEAVWAYREGASWYPETDGETGAVDHANEERVEHDSWEWKIERYLAGCGDEVAIAEVLEHGLGLEPRDWTRAAQIRVGTIMTNRLKWAKERPRRGATRQWVYRRPS